MNQRLRRALQRGGVAAQVRPEAWGVWRGQDRRGRMIGTLSGAEIDIMRLRGELKPIGDAQSEVLVWSGPPVTAPSMQTDAPALDKAPNTASLPLLETLWLGHHVPGDRARIRSACQSYLADLEWVAAGPGHSTMNWEAFNAGDRVKSANPRDPLQRMHEQNQARSRLSLVRSNLTTADFEFLQKLLRNDATRGTFARTYQQRPALIDQRALSILRTLLEAYFPTSVRQDWCSAAAS